jgi:pimeloyl-ACP methyl ester carboxylesterase
MVSSLIGGLMLDFLAQKIAAIGVTFMSLWAHPIAPTSCGQFQHIEYCYHAGSPNSQKLIYFMHGFGDDTKAWTVNWVTGQIVEEWKKNQVESPHVITISKKVWWYTEKSQGQELTEFVAWFESTQLHLSQSAPSISRVLYGDSMGGHNAFRWAADFPRLFDKMALICPAFPRSFVKNPGPSEGFAPWEFLGQQLISEYYRKSSAPNYNPLAPPTPYSELVPKVHLIASDRDDFGFFAGDTALHELLDKNSLVSQTYEVQSVPHCKVEATELARFLAD